MQAAQDTKRRATQQLNKARAATAAAEQARKEAAAKKEKQARADADAAKKKAKAQVADIQAKAKEDVQNIQKKAAAKVKEIEAACTAKASTPSDVLSTARLELELSEQNETLSGLALLELGGGGTPLQGETEGEVSLDVAPLLV